MEELLISVTRVSIRVIDAMALIVILYGTVEAFLSGLRAMIFPSQTNAERRAVWMRYARWLVAGLTFQLAADIIETSIAPSWEDIGRLAAIATIRTLLNFFLERDVEEMRGRETEAKLPRAA
jgi:uncharacterized membrane protein